MMTYDWTWSWGIGMLFMAVFWIVVIAAAVWLVTALTRRTDPAASGRGSGTAISVLEERLARGEIDVEEFRARKAALEGVRH